MELRRRDSGLAQLRLERCGRLLVGQRAGLVAGAVAQQPARMYCQRPRIVPLGWPDQRYIEQRNDDDRANGDQPSRPPQPFQQRARVRQAPAGIRQPEQQIGQSVALLEVRHADQHRI